MSNRTDTHFSFAVGVTIGAFALVLAIKGAVGSALKGEPADMSAEAVAARIQPVAQLNTGAPIVPEVAAAPVAAAGGARSGEAVFQGSCFACHGTGAAGAPKVGDAAAWGPRASQGIDTLLSHAVNGFQGNTGVMPPRGTCGNCSDDELKAAIEYMVGNSK